MRWVRLKAVIEKELLHMVRDIGTLRMMIFMPVMMMVLFGYVASSNIENVPTAAVIQDKGDAARVVIEKFSATKYFKIVAYPESAGEAGELIQRGDVKVAIIIPSDYAQRLDQGVPAQIQVLVDGSDPTISREAMSTSEMLGQLLGNEVLITRLARASGRTVQSEAPVEVRTRIWYNPDMDSIKFNLPGLMGIILQNTTVIGIAGAMVKEKEHGTIEQLIVTPVRPIELVVGKLIPYAAMSLINTVMVVLMAIFLFGLQIAGSMMLLGAVCFVFIVGSLGVGILFSTVAKNQAQASQISMLFLLPSMILSGFFFPRDAMPKALQLMGEAIPLTHLTLALRGIVLKAAGIGILWKPITALAVYSVLMMTLASLRFRKKLD